MLFSPAPLTQTDSCVLQKIACTECAKKGLVCRVNFLHGAQCNHCTNVKGHCSLVPAHGNGTAWTKEQRVYILYDFQARADATAPHPATSVRDTFARNPAFTVPAWFIQRLNALKPSFWAPGGTARMYKPRSAQSRRTTFLAPTPDNEDTISRARTPSLPPAGRTDAGPGRNTTRRKTSRPRGRLIKSSKDRSDDDTSVSHTDGHDSSRGDGTPDSGERSIGSGDDEQEGEDDGDNLVDRAAEPLTPGMSRPASRNRSQEQRNVVASSGDDQPTSVDADAVETTVAPPSIQQTGRRKRAREESQSGDDQDVSMDGRLGSPAPPVHVSKRPRQHANLNLSVPPPTGMYLRLFRAFRKPC